MMRYRCNIRAMLFCAGNLCASPLTMESQDNQAAAVPVVQLRSNPTCGTCRVRSTIIATIPDDAFEIETVPVVVARNSRGLYLVGGKNGRLGLFDERGTLLRTLGRQGGGPGEFRSITRVYLGFQDSVIVYDMFARRMTVIDPGLTHVVRTTNFFDHRGIVPLQNGTYVTSGSLPTLRTSGLSIHLVSAQGAVLKSASADSAAFRRQPERMLGRSLSRVNESSFIAAPMHRYRFELWSFDLKLQRVFERTVDWFPPLSDDQLLDVPSRTPLPMQLLSVSGSGNNGMLIAVLFSGSSSFRPDPALAGRKGEVSVRESGSGPSLNKYVDTTIEFIELKTALVTGTGRFPGFYGPVYQPPSGSLTPLYYIVRERAGGGEAIEIVRFDLEGQKTRNHLR